MLLLEIYLYPIKSCQGIQLQQAEVTPKGLRGDRELMLVNSQGKFLTQRQYPQLAKVKVAQVGEKLTLSLPAQGISPLTFLPQSEGPAIAVEIWGDRTVAIDQGEEVAQWFQQALALQEPLRLVRQSPAYPRLLKPRYLVKPEDQVSFADGYPLLLTATASLAELNRRLSEFPDYQGGVPMNRFRPNLVITTDEPFIEDRWRLLQIGEITLALVKPCSRCLVITTDQNTGMRNKLKEPLRTLSTFRQFGTEGVMFGENLVPRTTGILQVGEPIKVLELQEF